MTNTLEKEKKIFTFSPLLKLNISKFVTTIQNNKIIFTVSQDAKDKLEQTRRFIDYIIKKKLKFYGISTGFADLRNHTIDENQLTRLSINLINSHDGAIGTPLPHDVVYGAMILRAHALSKGFSGISIEGLNTLIGMINSKIIPIIYNTGSLGASGDLAFLARLARTMQGDPVPVLFQGKILNANEALKIAGINPLIPQAKEGLALINGTSFLTSMAAIAYEKEKNCLYHISIALGLFLNSVNANPSAFYQCIHAIRGNNHQTKFAKMLLELCELSEIADFSDQQDDYCIRCLPQILGPRIFTILEQEKVIENELNAVTDNPLIFKDSEISSEVQSLEKIRFEGFDWSIFSGGNFHGENITTSSDIIRLQNAKIALTIERHLTYLLNPFRNKDVLPIYLIQNRDLIGLNSGFMIAQYTGNALTHKICHNAQPVGTMNLTSANESEDIVSYAATAAEKLYEQVEYLEQLTAIYLLTAAQAYALIRNQRKRKNILVDKLFDYINEIISLPRTEDESLTHLFEQSLNLIQSKQLIQHFDQWIKKFYEPSST